jgi:flagellin
MALSVNTNVAALNAYRNLSTTQNDMGKSLEKLSSGFRINRAADDAAGLAISEGMRSQMGGIKVGIRNAQDGISLVQTAEGALNETTSILQRMRDLTVQAGNSGSLTKEATDNIQVELTQLTDELDRVADSTTFNGQNLFGAKDGTDGYKGTFQIGANAGETVEIEIDRVDSDALFGSGGLTELSGGTTSGDKAAIDTAVSGNLDKIDSAIKDVSTSRAKLGATQNRFEHTINNANVALENVTASESRIRDTDMASEMVNFTRSQILSQAGTAMLSQAKSIPQGVLSLLQ